MRVKFVRDYTVRDSSGQTFAAGREYDMSEASAQHFINRRAAILVAVATGAGQKAATGDKEVASMAAPETATETAPKAKKAAQ